MGSEKPGKTGGICLPADGHVGFDGFAGRIQVSPCVQHVEPDGVEFVAGGSREAIAGDVAGAGFVAQSEHALGNHP